LRYNVAGELYILLHECRIIVVHGPLSVDSVWIDVDLAWRSSTVHGSCLVGTWSYLRSFRDVTMRIDSSNFSSRWCFGDGDHQRFTSSVVKVESSVGGSTLHNGAKGKVGRICSVVILQCTIAVAELDACNGCTSRLS